METFLKEWVSCNMSKYNPCFVQSIQTAGYTIICTSGCSCQSLKRHTAVKVIKSNCTVTIPP
jgi:hypothetical protein